MRLTGPYWSDCSDGDGNRFTPSYAKKKGRRYRYYVSRALLKLHRNEQAGPTRLPAGEVEELVITQIRRLLQSPQRLLEIFGEHSGTTSDSKRLLERAAETANRVEDLLASVIQRVAVHPRRIEIQVGKVQLMQVWESLPAMRPKQVNLRRSGSKWMQCSSGTATKSGFNCLRIVTEPSHGPSPP